MRTQNVAIDSMTVITPITSFIYLDKSLLDIVQEINIETAEILSSKTKPIYIEHKGIKARVFILNLFSEEYLSVTYSSKMLKENYLEGISAANFLECFQFVRKFLQIDIEYNTYLTVSTVFDCDFKADFVADNQDYFHLCEPFLKLPNARKFYSKAESYLSGKKLNGFTLINRKDANITSPFVKFYDKKEELETNSVEFYNYFFTSEKRNDLHNLKRVEVTVKNSKHFESISALKAFENKNNLYFLLYLSQDTILLIINELLGRYSILPRDVKRSEIVQKSSPTDYIICQSFLILMKENKMTLQHCLNLLDDYPALNANTSSRIKRRLKDAFASVLKEDELKSLKLLPKDAFFI